MPHIQLLVKISSSSDDFTWLSYPVYLLSLSFLLYSATGSCSCLVSPNHSIPQLQSPLLSANRFLLLAPFHSVFQCPNFCVSVYVFNQSQSLPLLMFSVSIFNSNCIRLLVLISLNLKFYGSLWFIDLEKITVGCNRTHFLVQDYSQIN